MLDRGLEDRLALVHRDLLPINRERHRVHNEMIISGQGLMIVARAKTSLLISADRSVPVSGTRRSTLRAVPGTSTSADVRTAYRNITANGNSKTPTNCPT